MTDIALYVLLFSIRGTSWNKISKRMEKQWYSSSSSPSGHICNQQWLGKSSNGFDRIHGSPLPKCLFSNMFPLILPQAPAYKNLLEFCYAANYFTNIVINPKQMNHRKIANDAITFTNASYSFKFLPEELKTATMLTFDIEAHANDIAATGKIIWGLINNSYNVTQTMQTVTEEAQKRAYTTQSMFIQTGLPQPTTTRQTAKTSPPPSKKEMIS